MLALATHCTNHWGLRERFGGPVILANERLEKGIYLIPSEVILYQEDVSLMETEVGKCSAPAVRIDTIRRRWELW